MSDYKKWGILKRTAGGSLSEPWFRDNLKANKNDTIECFSVPGTEAVLLMKRDPFAEMPQRVHDLLKSDEELKSEQQDMIRKALEEHEVHKGIALEPADGE